MTYSKDIREEQLKNEIAKDYFCNYDCTRILGNIDFCVSVKDNQPALFETESLLWAEAKNGIVKDIKTSFVQLILTIGKARTMDKFLPPPFLGAFDCERIAFIPYHEIVDFFYINDFNWNVTPSDHSTKEFLQLYERAKDVLERSSLIYRFGQDDKELNKFISQNLRTGKDKVNRMSITKNNFITIYGKWREKVMPTINVDWDEAKKIGILDADFYLADLLSKENTTLKDKLRVLLRGNHYRLHERDDQFGGMFREFEFLDGQKAYNQFWNLYTRPPRKGYWEYIVGRRDLLVPQDVRERKGSYFTPRIWVEKSQEYLAETLGENWQDEYVIWDCAAGTGNLLNGLTNKYNIWASTLDQADVDVMKDRVKNGANLLENHIFQFDFLNDDFANLPKPLRKIVENPEERKKIIVYINPPYLEASNARTNCGTGANRIGASESKIKERYKLELGRASNEMFAQFFVRIVRELGNAKIAIFSTLKILQGPNFTSFRETFQAQLKRLFIAPANTFDNVTGKFPIGFQIWDTSIKEVFEEIDADVFSSRGEYCGCKKIYAYRNEKYIRDWLRNYYDKDGTHYAYLRFLGTDFQNNNGVFVTLAPSSNDLKQVKGNWITPRNLIQMAIYFSVRLCIEATWINDRDQFLLPNDGWLFDKGFQLDCLIYMIFHGQNRVSSQHGTNHWIPFTENEVAAKEKFESHFMSDYLKNGSIPETQTKLKFTTQEDPCPIDSKPVLSAEATAVMNAGRELWRYYHQQPTANPNASFYDIRSHFQGFNAKGNMNPDSTDETYTTLIGNLRQAQKRLSAKIEPKVYEYGFLKK